MANEVRPRLRTSRVVRRPATRRGVPAKGQERLTTGGILLIASLGALAIFLGMSRVRTVFHVRDFEIETNRVQEMTRVGRDEIKRLEARLGDMRRDETLRQAAIGAYGMVEPTAEQVSLLEVDTTRVAVYARVESKAGEAVAQRQKAYADAGWEAN